MSSRCRILLLFLLLSALSGARELPDGVAWGLELPGSVSGNLLPLTEQRFALVANANLMAVSALDGSILWRTQLGEEPAGRLALVGPDLILVSQLNPGELGVFDANTGRLRWRAEGMEPVVLGGQVYLRRTHELVLLDGVTGEALRTFPLPNVRVFEVEPGRLWYGTDQVIGALDPATGEEVFRENLVGAWLSGPGVVTQNQTARFLDRSGRLLATHKFNRLGFQEGLVVDRGQNLIVYDRQGRKLWSREANYSYDEAEGNTVRVGDGLYDLRTGKLLARGQVLAVGDRAFSLKNEALLVSNLKGQRLAKYPGIFSGYSHELFGAKVGKRILVGSSGTILALGEGPGTMRFGGASELRISAESPQVPPHVRLSVSGRFLRGANLEVLRSGQVVARKHVPITAGYEPDSRGLSLKVPGPGEYEVVVRGAGREAREKVSLTELALLGRLSPARLYVQLQSLTTRRPVAGGSVSLEGVGQATTDANGEASFPLPAGDQPERRVDVRWKGQTLSATAPAQTGFYDRVYLQTDRPLYRPGQKVYFRGVAMRVDDAGEQVDAGRELPVEIRDSADNKLLDTRLTADEFGVIAGQLTLPAGAPLGRYTLRAGPGQLPFDVQEFRKPPFQVEVRSTQPLWTAGQTMSWEIEAGYFFGGPVPNAEVRWSLSALELYDSGWDDPLATDYRSYRDFVTEGTTTLDDQGRAILRIPSPKRSRDARYYLTVTVLGGEGREVEQSASAIVQVGAYNVSLRPTTWVQKSGAPLTVELRTFDRLSRPHAARGELLVYPGWGGKRPLLKVPFQTGANGLGTATFRPSRTGYLRLEAVSLDSSGRKLTASTWAWVSGKDESDYSYPSLQIVPSKTSPRPGETIRCLLLADKPGTVWLTVEGNRLFDRRVIVMTGRTATVELPIKPEYAPEVKLRATMPRLDNSVSDDIVLRVPVVGHRLDVKLVKDREDFRPGKTAELTLETGRRASVALAIVDEALLALKPEYAGDIYAFFHETRPSLVESFEVVPKKPWVAGFQTIESQAPIRENFQDTAFWNAQILTDERGQAKVSVPLPDNLTTWRATARAVAPPAEVGQTTAQLLVRLPIMVQSYAPRFLVHKDQSDVKTLAYNRTPTEQTVRLQLEPTGARAVEPAQAEAAIGPDASAELRTRVEVESQQEVVLLARADAGAEGDAERIRVPVKPFGLPREQYFSGILLEPRELEYRIPSEGLLGRLDLSADPSVAQVIAGTLVYLADYPYGCVEQTMSRFVPTLAASKALEQLDVPSPLPEGDLQAMVTASLDKLYGYQHEDGGWGWWEHDATNPFLTGYVISGLVRSRQAGWTIREDVLVRGAEAARQMLDTASLEDRAYLAWALSLAGHPPVETLTALYAEPKLSTYGRALVALGLQNAGRKPDLAWARALAVDDGRGIHWEAASATAYGWTDDNLEATCLVLQALLNDDPRDPLLTSGANWIVAQRRGDRWKSTKDSAGAVFFLTDYVLATRQTSTSATMTARLDGQAIVLKDGQASIDVGPGVHRLSLVPQSGAPLVSARLTYQEAPRLDVLAPEQQGLTVERVYHRPGQRAPLAAPLRPQDDLEVELTLDAPKAMSYVMIEDLRAAGMEVPEQTVKVDRFEIHDDRTVFFLSHLPAGRTVLRYRQRAETPGRFQALPARAALMYRPEVYGTSQSRLLEILRK